MTGVQGDAAGLPGLLGEGSQDAAVCHDLLTRVDDQAALLASLAGVLAEGGVLSLGFANRDWLALRAGRRGDHAGALRLVQGGGPGGLMPGAPVDAKAEAVTLEEAGQLLDKAGFELVTASGVGVFADAGDDDLGPAELATLVELERLVAGREPYRSSADAEPGCPARVFVPHLPYIPYICSGGFMPPTQGSSSSPPP